MKQGEIYEKSTEELQMRIEELEEENVALGEEVTQWMDDYESIKNERDELNLALIRKDQREARDTRLLLDILRELESSDYDLLSVCSWIRNALKE